jgi:uncharacterized protein (TIRG00374 family)
MTDAPAAAGKSRGRALTGGARGLALKIALGGLLGAALLYFFLRGTDFARLGQAMASASPGLFALALLFASSGFVVRAFRWRTYLRPIKLVPADACFDVLMIGYFVSLVVPRSGDVLVRPLLMARAEKIPVGTAFATIAVERLFDTLTVVVCFATYLSFAASRLHGMDIGNVQQTGRTLLVLSLAGISMLVLLRFHQERFLRAIGWGLGPLPLHWRERILRQAHAFADGLNLFRNIRNAALSIVQSLLAWFVVGVSFWLAVLALGIPIRPFDSCLLIGLGALGVAVPAPFGLALLPVIEVGCRALGVADEGLAKAAALLILALSVLPTLVLGAFSTVRRGVRVRELEAAAEGELATDTVPLEPEVRGEVR